MDARPFSIHTTVYVREGRSLVLSSVRGHSRGLGSPLWRGGWRLDMAAGDFADVAPEDAFAHFVYLVDSGRESHAMTPSEWGAWIRTWRLPRD